MYLRNTCDIFKKKIVYMNDIINYLMFFFMQLIIKTCPATCMYSCNIHQHVTIANYGVFIAIRKY